MSEQVIVENLTDRFFAHVWHHLLNQSATVTAKGAAVVVLTRFATNCFNGAILRLRYGVLNDLLSAGDP